MNFTLHLICFLKKKYNTNQSYTTKAINNNITISDKHIKLPKLGKVKFANSRKFNGRIISATIRKNPNSKFYISILVDEEIPKMKKTNKDIGIDLGITHFAITTAKNMQKIDNPRFIKNTELKLKKEQRILSRRYEQSKKDNKQLKDCKNYQKQKLKVAKLHEKVSNQRNDFLHKLSTKIIFENDLIGIEDLNVKGMIKNPKLSKAISDVSWTSFRRMLEYKSEWYGKKLVVIDRYYPSSQICSLCGSLEGKKPLSVRTWECTSCNKILDRDINASHNILNESKRLLNQYKN